MTATRWHEVADVTALHAAARDRVVDAATRAIAARGAFHLVLAGGGTPRGVYRLLRAAPMAWPRWHIYHGDERCLPVDHAERNSRAADTLWLDHVAIPRSQIHAIPAERGPHAGAAAYAATLADLDDFDLVLLGLGEDGHTASLFPAHPWGDQPGAPDTLAITGAPKPPPERVSMSAARLGRTRAALFLVDGVSKLDAIARWQAGEPLPAAAIAPVAGVDVLVTTTPSERSAD